jgi:protein-tyrosine kinase
MAIEAGSVKQHSHFQRIVRPSDGPFLLTHLFDYFYKVLIDLSRKNARRSCAVVFSSCNRGEGVSTIALNCATALASDPSLRVLLVDGNLRRPALHEYFGVPREHGFADLIQGDIDQSEAIRQVSPGSLSFISAGRPAQAYVSLFETPGFIPLIEELRAAFDYIIFDSSPIMAAPETPLLASRLDGMIMVLQSEETRWEVAAAAQTNIERANVALLGAILNKKKLYIPAVLYRHL